MSRSERRDVLRAEIAKLQAELEALDRQRVTVQEELRRLHTELATFEEPRSGAHPVHTVPDHPRLQAPPRKLLSSAPCSVVVTTFIPNFGSMPSLAAPAMHPPAVTSGFEESATNRASNVVSAQTSLL